jgi:ectoine hydroxylase-related dioxygenase (phytanoyl-CoA dioxygenase family)
MNFFLPFVDTNKYNTIWAESKQDKGDYSPFLLKYGEVKRWNGANLMHGNVVNTSGESRVSVDFRVLPISQLDDKKRTTLTQKIPFEIGGYWEKI